LLNGIQDVRDVAHLSCANRFCRAAPDILAGTPTATLWTGWRSWISAFTPELI
jgi:hypothetical protein